LSNLQTLDLTNNQISVIPDLIRQMRNLQRLHHYGNQITDGPESIAL
jgi:Leucine-rich repeat (LRR) protein